MRAFSRWIVSWSLYGIGDLNSRPMSAFDWAWLYPTYNQIMLWSCDVQGKYNSNRWPWGKGVDSNVNSSD